LGWNDISFYGGGVGGGAVQTPNIDRIAAEGVHFSNGYAGNATCAPSRAALPKGSDTTRYGFEVTPAPAERMRMAFSFEPHREQLHPGYFLEENLAAFPPLEEQSVPASEILLPELLADRGYHSMILGKWHLGENDGNAPNDQGFDQFLGFLSGAAMFAQFDETQMVKSIQTFEPIEQFLRPNQTFPVRYNKKHHFAQDQKMTHHPSTKADATERSQTNIDRFLCTYPTTRLTRRCTHVN